MQSIKKEDLKLLSIFDASLSVPPPEFDFDNPQYDPKELAETLAFGIKAFNGMGLSANQVGLPVKVFSWLDDQGSCHTVFNPVVTLSSKKQIAMKEGCLSLPNVWLTISRPESCVMDYQEVDGTKRSAEFKGMYARIVLHEYDHMIGRNFTMYASKLKIQRAVKAVEKKAKKSAEKAVIQGILRGKNGTTIAG